jgi:hypothetical protein
VGLLDRLRRRKAAPVVALDPADPSLVVLVEARAVLVRHHLVGLPDAAAVAQAAELLGQDGYTVAPAPDGSPLAVHASRTQVLTALSASQERSRMAGLAQRLGGDVDGYDVLVHPS